MNQESQRAAEEFVIQNIHMNSSDVHPGIVQWARDKHAKSFLAGVTWAMNSEAMKTVEAALEKITGMVVFCEESEQWVLSKEGRIAKQALDLIRGISDNK